MRESQMGTSVCETGRSVTARRLGLLSSDRARAKARKTEKGREGSGGPLLTSPDNGVFI